MDRDSVDSYKKLIACKIGPRPNDDHVHVGGMDWLSKIFETENVLDNDSIDSYKTDRFQDMSQDRVMVMSMAATCIGYQNFSGPKMFGLRFC